MTLSDLVRNKKSVERTLTPFFYEIYIEILNLILNKLE